MDDGEMLVLVGPSGCGKRMILRVISGLEEPTDGNIRADARPVTNLPPGGRNVSMVFQNYAPYPHMIARAKHRFQDDGHRRLHEGGNQAPIIDVVATIKINNLLDRKPPEFSGG
jgi:ABC-type sugar transport system ATPase subunit